MNDAGPPAGVAPQNAPRGFRGPFTRWPRISDGVLAAAAFLVTVLVVDAPGDAVVVRSLSDVPVGALLVSAAASAALYWRRSAPLAVLTAALLGWVVTLGIGDAEPGLVTIIALYSTGRYVSADKRSYALVAAAITVLTVDGVLDPILSWGDTVFGWFVLFLAWYVGRRLRMRQERAAERAREQAAEARRIVIEERARIARELHDVVAHRVSLMTVQAGAAKAVVADDVDSAVRAMAAVEDAGRQALAELRHLVGVLRPEADPHGLGPQPGLAELPRLVEQVRDAGLDVSLAVDSVPTELPARVDLFAYRIVQEALTNVLKHGGRGVHAQVRLVIEQGAIVIEVQDDGPGGNTEPGAGGTVPGSSGHGIVGMRERALLLGGSLDAGPGPAGGFRVVARLPIGGEPE